MKSLGLLVLRLVLGGLFVAHGYPKLFGGQGESKHLADVTKSTLGEGFVEQVEQGGIGATTGMMESLGLPNAKAAGWSLALVEFAGGLALIFGFVTRPMALALAFSQAVAINKVHASEGLFGGYEYNIALIGGTAALAIAGPGKIAIDG
ncbi:MAG: DoxX family protein [Chloroflexia bacterium]|nr:DoxX family protein [Chloroflexia bacterium]